MVYQIYPRSFADGNGDGIGDLAGILARLDYLQALGVDVVWLSPVYPSPMDDNGYDISDYQDIDPVFGTLAEFDELIAAAHTRGIKIVMDLVVNHTSDEHPWFQESRTALGSAGVRRAKRDWYWWRPPRPGGIGGEPGAEPTNWVSFFSGSAWEWDEPSGEYFLHLFSRKQPDLNWENPEVRAAIYAMMNWWLDRGVDGFRMDVINMISKAELIDSPGGELTSVMHGPRMHEFLQEMHREVFANRPAGLLTVGEMPNTTVDQARLYTDARRAELDMIFQFEHVDLDSGPAGKWDVRPVSLVALKTSLAGWQHGLADVGWNSLYWGNHDQPRAVSRFGSDAPEHREHSATALATVLHLQRGTPYIYQGDELGMTNYPFTSIDDFRDIESLNHYRHAVAAGGDPSAVLASMRIKSRDNARTPVQWDNSAHAGFVTSAGAAAVTEPWIAVNPNYVEINAAAQINDPDSVFNYHRRLIALRHNEPTVAHGDFTLLLPEHEQIFAFTRRHGGTELLVAANLSGTSVVVEGVDMWAGEELVLTNTRPIAEVVSPLVLKAWEARVYRRTKT